MPKPSAAAAKAVEVEPEIIEEPDVTKLENEADPELETESPELEEKEEETPDAGKDPEVEAGDLEDGEGDLEAEEPEESPEIVSLKEQIRQLTEKVEKGSAQPAAPAYQEPSEEQWAKMEEETGFSRQSIKFHSQREAMVIQRLEKYVDSKMGQFEKDAAISRLSKQKGFENISAHREGMEEYLKDFSPASHSNEKLLKSAMYYAIGKASGKTMKRVVNSKEANRKVIKKGTGHGIPRSAAPKARIKLTEAQDQARRAAGMSVEEYAKYQRPLSEIMR